MVNKSEEQNLVARFRQGDDSAFDQIVERHAADVAALANRLLGWPQDVDDIVQEVFLAALTGLNTFRGDCGLRSWLFTITINKCHRHRRHLSRHRWIRIEDNPPTLCLNEDAEMVAIDTESLAQIRRAIQTLPTKYREPIVLRYLQGLETAEICRILNITANTFNVRLNRARTKLKNDLGQLMKETP